MSSYRVSLSDTVILYDTLVHGIELPALVVNAINRKAEQYYIAEEYNFGSSARNASWNARDRGRRHPRFPADRQPGDFGLLPAMARDRGDASTLAIHEFEGRDHRQRERRLAAYPRQHGYFASAGHDRCRDRGRQRLAYGHDDCRWPGGRRRRTPAAGSATPPQEYNMGQATPAVSSKSRDRGGRDLYDVLSIRRNQRRSRRQSQPPTPASRARLMRFSATLGSSLSERPRVARRGRRGGERLTIVTCLTETASCVVRYAPTSPQ